jgi:hypothetical protein
MNNASNWRKKRESSEGRSGLNEGAPRSPLRGMRGLTGGEAGSVMADCCGVEGVECGSEGCIGDRGEGRSDSSNSGVIGDGRKLCRAEDSGSDSKNGVVSSKLSGF